MKAELIGHNYKYEISQIINIFIPIKKVEYGNINNDDKKALSVISKLTKENNTYFIETVLYQNNISFTDNSKICCTENKQVKKLVKNSLYNSMKKCFKSKIPWGSITGIRPSKIARELFLKGFSDEQIKAYYKENYFTLDEKIDLAIATAKNETKIINDMQKDGVSLYFGIPFCPTRCSYCSFFSTSAEKSKNIIEPYLDALFYEIDETYKIIKLLNLKIETIYIGGGTPTTLTNDQLNKLLNKITSIFDLKNLKEFTVEAGRPDTITKEKLLTLKSYKVDRISINPQTLNDATLLEIGRKHSVEDFLNSYYLSKQIGFKTINCDIIAGLPNETEEMFINTVDKILSLLPQNITIHTMSIKNASYIRQNIDDYIFSDGNIINNMILYAQNKLVDKGYNPYYLYRQKNILGNLENVGFSKNGYEGIYNVYIMGETQTIISFGAGSVTKLVCNKSGRIERIFNVKAPLDYLKRIDEMIERKKQIISFYN